MAEARTMRLNKVLREFNISLDRAVEFLDSKGYDIEARPTTKISEEVYQVLFEKFQTDKSKKVASKEVSEERKKEKEELRLAREKEQEEKLRKLEERRLKEKEREEEEARIVKAKASLSGPKQVGKIDLDKDKSKKKSKPNKEEKPKEVKKKDESKKEEPSKTKDSDLNQFFHL